MSRTALDRLKQQMSDSEASISSNEYFEDIEDDIKAKLNSTFEEVTLDDNTTIASIPQNTIINKSDTIPNIEINVQDTGDDSLVDDIMNNKPQKVNEELFNNNTQIQDSPQVKRRGRKKKEEILNDISSTSIKTTPTIKLASEPEPMQDSSNNNPIYNVLAKNLINELHAKHFKLNGFTDESMTILYNYMKNKF